MRQGAFAGSVVIRNVGAPRESALPKLERRE